MAIMAAPASAQAPPPAQNCIQNEFNLANGNSSTCTTSSCSLGCTANDVSIAEVVNVRDPSTGKQLVNCTANSPFSFIADFEIKTTSKESRSNIGLYIAENGTTVADALSVNNTCADNVIPPPAGFKNTNTTGKTPTIGANGHFLCAGTDPSLNLFCGTDYFDELDKATKTTADNCGDSSSSDAGGFGPSTQDVTLEITGFTCPNPATSNLPTCTVKGVTGPCAVLPNCTSWQVPGSAINCQVPTGTQGYSLSAVPGTSSKCNCGVITLPVLVQTPVIDVSKSCVTADSPAPASPPLNSACSSGTEGTDEVTYTVTVANNSNTGTITITQIKDSVYGTMYGTGACTPGAAGCVDSFGGCGTYTINAKASTTCTFTAHKAGDPAVATVTDTVSVSGTTQFAGAFGPSTSNSVTVTPTEAQVAATVTKGLGSPNLTAGCATANFTVDVHNTSSTTFDETETLTALTDSAFTNITSTSASVLGTTCGVATTSGGLGTLSGSAGGGTLPATIAPDGHYTCEFNAQFCGTLASIEDYGTGKCTSGTCTQGKAGSCTVDSDCDVSCLGLEHVNSITAVMNGDEGAADVVSPTANTLTTHVCLSAVTKP